MAEFIDSSIMKQIPDLLPWHETEWKQLQAVYAFGRLPHALLFTGAEGIGKLRFVSRFAAYLLCNTPSHADEPCGNCQSCRLFAKGNHPDYQEIVPDELGKAIKIDQIREFTGSAALTSHAGGYRVTVIVPADAMNINAANSLLKTLEEPVTSSVMLLITSQPGRLPATIRSRCRHIRFRQPERTRVIPWLIKEIKDVDPELLLRLASDSPLRAIKHASPELLKERQLMFKEFCSISAGTADPVAVADRWNKQDFLLTLNWLYSWVTDILRIKFNPETSDMVNFDQREHLMNLAQLLESKKLYRTLDQTYQALGSQGTQLNSQMILESLLLSWASD